MGKDLRQRALHELKQLSLLFIYLSLLLGSFTVYRRLVLAEYHISYRHYGYALVEAIIIAKVILIGEFMKLGDRYQDRPLIVPTLYKTVVFGLLVLAFTLLEDLLEGLVHHQSLSEIAHHALSGGVSERVAQSIVVLVAFVPLFAYRELGRLIGQSKINELFIRPPASTPPAGETS